jgi:hypothetical protein
MPLFQIILGAALLAQPPTVPGPSAEPPASTTESEPNRDADPLTLSPDEVQRCVDRLSSPSPLERRRAADTLLLAGPMAYEPLRRAYQTHDSYDLRRQIARLAMQIFVDQRVGLPPAFLGVQLGRPDYDRDPRIPQGADALVIQDIIPGTAADAARLRPGDLIVRLDGETIARDTDLTRNPAISRRIAERRPGDRCRLGIYRGQRAIDIDVTLGRRPWNLSFGADATAQPGWWLRPEQAARMPEVLREFDAWWRERFGPPVPGAELPASRDPRWRLRPALPNT